MNVTLANMGVPMIFVMLPQMIYFFIPVVIIEGLLARRIPVKDGKGRWGPVLIANLVSTVVGWPISWGLYLLVVMGLDKIGAHTLFSGSPLEAIAVYFSVAPWVPPYGENLEPMIIVAGAILLVPFFLASVIIERGVYYTAWHDTDRAVVRRFSWISNLFSYLFLYLAYGLLAGVTLDHIL
ncbi:MAG: hypothetical protein SFY80_02480 [Verrucomicrobiota bacterium]|nr:hypothetical protein [Verrucomicrobiota bacterium]